jgi:hypothetical protein
MRMHAHRGTIRRDVGAPPGVVAQAIADRILEAQRPEARVRDGRMSAAEVAGQRTRRIHVRSPVDGARGLVELRVAGRLELRHDQEHARGHAGFETGAIGHRETAGELHAERALAHVGGAELAQLTRQQVAEAARTRGHEAMRDGIQVQSSSRGGGSGTTRRDFSARLRMWNTSASNSRRVRAKRE